MVVGELTSSPTPSPPTPAPFPYFHRLAPVLLSFYTLSFIHVDRFILSIAHQTTLIYLFRRTSILSFASLTSATSSFWIQFFRISFIVFPISSNSFPTLSSFFQDSQSFPPNILRMFSNLTTKISLCMTTWDPTSHYRKIFVCFRSTSRTPRVAICLLPPFPCCRSLFSLQSADSPCSFTLVLHYVSFLSLSSPPVSCPHRRLSRFFFSKSIHSSSAPIPLRLYSPPAANISSPHSDPPITLCQFTSPSLSLRSLWRPSFPFSLRLTPFSHPSTPAFLLLFRAPHKTTTFPFYFQHVHPLPKYIGEQGDLQGPPQVIWQCFPQGLCRHFPQAVWQDIRQEA